MSFRGHIRAVANDLPMPPLSAEVECRRVFTDEELAALKSLGAAFKEGTAGSRKARDTLHHFLEPVEYALRWADTKYAAICITKRIIISEMDRLGRPYWSWSVDDCLDVACKDIQTFTARHGDVKSRQHIIYLLCTYCAFNRVTEIGRFHRYHLAIKVFGRIAIDTATDAIYDEMAKVGYVGHVNYGVSQVLHTAFLMERTARIEAITIDSLRQIADGGPRLLRRAAGSLSRTLERMGIVDRALDHYLEAGRARLNNPENYRASDGVASTWADACRRWYATAIGAPSGCEKTYYGLLKFGRWLASKHPTIERPEDVTRPVLIDWVTAVDRMIVGEWSNPTGNAARTMGKPLTARSKAAHIKMVKRVFCDLQDWEWIPKRFDPGRTLSVPQAISNLIGPAPRMVADDIWAKIVWAGLNLDEQDIEPRKSPLWRSSRSTHYPIELVRALAHLWLFAGLRSDEINRLAVGCIRWQHDIDDGLPPICLLDVPVGKTSTAFTKPVDAVVGKAIEAWQNVRPVHPAMLDAKTSMMVDFLFIHRGRRVAKAYVNERLIPLICRKAGVPREDARGPITSHRARATIATQLYNAKEPLTLFELKDWLGHADVRTTQHYAALTPTKLVAAFQRAGYFERNLRTISVLVDGDAVRSGAASRGEPWRYYDLGHGLCTYDFFDQCPHRMACAKCSFYVPKSSARAQALEAKGNLSRMLQEIPLLEGERAAVEDGIEAMAQLVDSLRDTVAPDGRTPVEIEASPSADASAEGDQSGNE